MIVFTTETQGHREDQEEVLCARVSLGERDS
jgi:hypothetical protein